MWLKFFSVTFILKNNKYQPSQIFIPYATIVINVADVSILSIINACKSIPFVQTLDASKYRNQISPSYQEYELEVKDY